MLRKTILLLMAAGGVAFAVLAVLAAAGLADPRLAAVAFGVALIAMGADELAGARAGRLSSLGWGLVLVSAGALLIALDRVPLTARLVGVAVFAAGFALGLVGQSYDRRRAEAARGGPDAESV